MDKKQFIKSTSPEDIKGFEDFIEGAPDGEFLNANFASKNKKKLPHEYLTFIQNDGNRLDKINTLINKKIFVIKKYEQGPILIKQQLEEISNLRTKIFQKSIVNQSGFRKSLTEIFDSYFLEKKS